MNILPDHIREAIDSACERAQVACVGISVRGQDKQLKLEVAIDTPTGVGHEQCRNVSANIDEALSEDEWYGRIRAVDVSSPGAEAPARYLWQLSKHVGRTVHCTLKDGSVVEGSLVETTENTVVISPARSTKSKAPETPANVVTWDDIEDIHVVIKF